MEKRITIDEILESISKGIAKIFFNEQFGRTWSQKAEDDWGIPQKTFHTGLVVVGTILLAKYLNSRD